MGINPLTRVNSINYPIIFFFNNNSCIVIKTIKFYLFWIIALFLYIPNIFYFLLNEYKKCCFKNFNEINNLEYYFSICNKENLLNPKKFKKLDNPKVSIITTVFNREKYILRFLRSIQNQFFDEIEIIIVDDNSKDNSSKLTYINLF